jgi:acylphosphatase
MCKVTVEGKMVEADLSRLHITVEGRVQGVGFRYFVAENSQRLKLTGWVRNRWDGSVEMIAEGNRSILEQLLALVRRGPRSSLVLGIKTDWQESTGEFRGFRIRSTR